jgi:hypothetical protein
MKTLSPQFELPGAEQVFNLAGEILACPTSTAHHAPDRTPDIFATACQFRPLRRRDGSYTRRCADCGALESEHPGASFTCPACRAEFPTTDCNVRPDAIMPECGPYVTCPRCGNEFPKP